ncbi:MAG: glycosyltransferase family 39 protein [Firmicutes bacterium]|nr:glycosyltransferase family 39 protein [Bacillota bacterium]
MVGILFVILFVLLAAYAIWNYSLAPVLSKGIKKDNNAMYIIAVAAAAFLLKVILSAVYKGHETDMNCFIGWSNAAFEHGLGEFYSLDMFHDYPPGYMYVLYVVGALQKLFGFSGGAQYILVKLPAVICDIVTGVFIYKIARKKFSDGISALIASLYLFNPAAILNSSLWGQVDSVYTLLVLLMIYFISERKMIISYFMFALCIFIKPQAFIFTPLVIYGIIENVFLPKFNKDAFVKNLLWGLGAILMMLIISLPFGLTNVIDQYKATLSSYQYLTVNAFNIWGAFNQNWTDLNAFTTVLGYIILAAIVAYSAYVFFKSKNNGKYYFVGALLSFATFMLSTKMHDRYAFPAMILLLMAFITTEDRDDYTLYSAVTLSQFFNTAWVLFIYETDINKYFKSPVINAASFVNIAIFIYMIYITQKHYVNYSPKAAAVSAKSAKSGKKSSVKYAPPAAPKKQFHFSLSAVFPKITRIDVIAMIVITAVYSGIALYDLGDMHAPESEYMVSDGEVTLDLGDDYSISKYKFFLGSYELGEERALTLTMTTSDNIETYSQTITDGSVFHWEEKDISAEARYITLSTNGSKLSLKEFALLDSDGNVITPVSASVSGGEALFDEQDEVPERSTFRNGTYFDEIYHARTGYEFVHSLSVYEWTHPPLGKVFIALGILLFGMCPFGWRIVGTVFGIIMVPIIYMFAKKLLKKSWLAIITCLLFTFDFMHFAQTRIATIDVYVTFFIMLMYYFMYKYYSSSFYDTPFKKTLGMLALCGTCMGLGIASKWTGIYAGAGLAVLFFITLYRRYSEYRYAVKYPSGTTDGISHKFIIENFKPYMIKTLLWCCLFFIVVPIIIYCLSYIPYLKAPDSNGLQTIIDNQHSMLTYHSKTVLGSEHSFSSRWYEWIIMKRPIWYYSGTVSEGIKEGISSFGNPLVWWLGIPAFFYMVYLIFKKKDKNALFLVIAYLAQLVSWIPITRLTFIYHYFPCVPFIVLMIGYSLLNIYNGAKNKKATMYCIFGYAALVIVMFIMFYPVLSGQPVSVDYVKTFLKWFDSWVLI